MAMLASTGVASAKLSAPPPAAASHTGTVARPATSLGSKGAVAANATPAPQIPPAPPSGSSTSLPPAPSWIPRLKQLRNSSNWSGYSDDSISGNYFNYVYTRWTEPKFTCSGTIATHGSETSQWIGIDGDGNAALEQAGMIEGCTRSRQGFHAMFWETIPDPPHVYSAGRPGDQMEAAVKYLGSGQFQFVVKDLTIGQTLNVTEPCAASRCPLASTEAISEWPGRQLRSGITLTKFSKFPFYNFYATSYYAPNGGSYYGWFGSTNLWTTHGIQTTGPKQVKPNGRFPRGTRVVMAPSALLQGGRAFFETWKYPY
jgi:hypothetical protein